MQLDGKRFFYVNPLEVVPEACEKDQYKRHVKPQRQKWFGCACCPPNIIRLLASLEDYLYSAENDDIYIHLYAGGGADFEIDGRTVGVSVETDYPWSGRVAVTLSMEAPTAFALHPRVPGWCRKYSIEVNGEALDADVNDGYAEIRRTWRDGDRLILDMDMPVRLIRANPKVREDIGELAVARGPLVYCLEEADNGPDLHLLKLGGAKPEAFEVKWMGEKLGGIVELTSPGIRETDAGWGEVLYSEEKDVESAPAQLTWIPYYSWANREPGEMRVWVRR